MITIVIAGYAVLMLTIVLALFTAARRPSPKPAVQIEEMRVRRSVQPVLMPSIPTSERGGTEVLAFEA
jgi:hypothetical protein